MGVGTVRLTWALDFDTVAWVSVASRAYDLQEEAVQGDQVQITASSILHPTGDTGFVVVML